MGAYSTQSADRVPVRAAAATLGIPRGWVLRFCQEGRLRVRTERIGSAWYVECRSLDRLGRALRGDGGRGI